MNKPPKEGWYYVVVADNGEESIKRDYFDGTEWHHYGPLAIKEFFETLPPTMRPQRKKFGIVANSHDISKRAGILSSMSWLLMDAYNKIDEAEHMLESRDGISRTAWRIKRTLGDLVTKVREESNTLVKEMRNE